MSIFEPRTKEEVENFIQAERKRYSYDNLPEHVVEALIYRHLASYDHTESYNKIKLEVSDMTYQQLKRRRESQSAISQAKEVIKKEEQTIRMTDELLDLLARSFQSHKE